MFRKSTYEIETYNTHKKSAPWRFLHLSGNPNKQQYSILSSVAARARNWKLISTRHDEK